MAVTGCPCDDVFPPSSEETVMSLETETETDAFIKENFKFANAYSQAVTHFKQFHRACVEIAAFTGMGAILRAATIGQLSDNDQRFEVSFAGICILVEHLFAPTPENHSRSLIRYSVVDVTRPMKPSETVGEVKFNANGEVLDASGTPICSISAGEGPAYTLCKLINEAMLKPR